MTEKRFKNHDDTILDNQGEQLITTDEIVNKLNEQAETIQQLEELIETYKSLHSMKMIKSLQEENEALLERNNRQKETIVKQQETIDGYIDVKAKLNAKIAEFETKSEEYELSACGCGARQNAVKVSALEEFKEEIYRGR